jgi:hypothetical protein
MPVKTTKRAAAEQLASVRSALTPLLSKVRSQGHTDAENFQAITNYFRTRDPDPIKAMSGIRIYYYRKFPAVNFQQIGQTKTNLEGGDCVGKDGEILNDLPNDIRGFLVDKYGGGTFRVSINDKSLDLPGGNTQVAQTLIKIDDEQNPPIVDPKTLNNSDGPTATWITKQLQRGLLIRDGDGVLCFPSERNANQPQTLESAAVKILTGQANRSNAPGADTPELHAQKRAVDIVTETAQQMLRSQPNPVEMVTQMMALIPKGDSSAAIIAPMMGLITTLITTGQQQQMQLVTLLIQSQAAKPAPAAEPTPGADQLTAVERIMRMAAKMESGKTGPTWVDQLKELLPALAPAFAPVIARAFGAPAVMPGLPAQLAAPPPAQQVIDTGAGTMPAPQPAPGQVIVLTNPVKAAIADRAYVALARGQRGDQFAEALEVMESPLLYEELYKLGREGFRLMLNMGANAAQLTLPQAQAPLAAFVESFIGFGEEPAQQQTGAQAA